MGESSCWLIAFHLNTIDPFHVFNIKNRYRIVVDLIIKIRGTKITAKEDKKHLIYYTTLFLFFLRIFTWNMRNCHPFLLSHIERIIILNKSLIVSSENHYFITVSDHIMKTSTRRQSLLSSGRCELHIKFCEWIVKLATTIALV